VLQHICATLDASSGFDQPSMIALASSRILELVRGCGRVANYTLGSQLAIQANKAGSDSRPKWVNAAGPAIPGSLQPGVFGLRLLQDRNIGVGVLPEREKVLIGTARFGVISLQKISASKTEMR